MVGIRKNIRNTTLAKSIIIDIIIDIFLGILKNFVRSIEKSSTTKRIPSEKTIMENTCMEISGIIKKIQRYTAENTADFFNCDT